MKNLNVLIAIFTVVWLSGCAESREETVTYKINEPVFMPVEQFRQAVRVIPEPMPLAKQGKIAFFKDYLYISEPEKGIHIIDNRNPEHPVSVGFIELLGNADMAIKDNILYADSYIDMVWFDISSPATPKFLGRKVDVFPEAFPKPENEYGIDYSKVSDRTKGVVVAWKLRERTETYIREHNIWGWWPGVFEKGDMVINSSPQSGAVGKTGSMSRFAIYENYLYTVMSNQLGVYNIETANPKKVSDNFYVGWNVETIFSYKNCMYMGTPTGMLIYSVEKPEKPERLASVVHVLGCDPVVVEDDVAYVTIHSGNFCGQNSNQLLIYNVSNPRMPKHLVSYEMTKPKGLGVDNKTLFVCDEGLRVFDATDPLTIMAKENKLAHFPGMAGYDVIAFNNVLMMIAEDGIYQYDYTNLKDIKFLSKLKIGK